MKKDVPRVPTVHQVFYVIALTFLILIFFELLFSGFHNRIKLLFIEILTILPVMIFIRAKRLSAVDVFRLKPVSIKILVISTVVGFSLSILMDEADRLIQLILPMRKEIAESLRELLLINSTVEFIIVISSVVIVASFAEEMLFRGFFQGAMEKQITDTTKAIMTTALVFAFVHFNPWWFLQILVLGVVMGVLVWKTDSIFPSIIIHGVNNGLAVIFANTQPEKLGLYLFNGHVSPVLIILSTICLYFSVKYLYKLTEHRVDM